MKHWALMAIVTTFTLVLSINPIGYAWHENLGFDANKAAELYQTKPNDPAIVQWKNALQFAINGMDKCFDISDFQKVIDCQPLILTINSNCQSHPNELLACNDSRLPQYPSILKQAQDAQQKAQEADIRNLKEYYSNYPDLSGRMIIDKCIKNADGSLNLEARSGFCVGELSSLQKECQTKSKQYSYCKDQRFVTYLGQHNSTVTPYSNSTGNSTSSNSTNQ